MSRKINYFLAFLAFTGVVAGCFLLRSMSPSKHLHIVSQTPTQQAPVPLARRRVVLRVAPLQRTLRKVREHSHTHAPPLKRRAKYLRSTPSPTRKRARPIPPIQTFEELKTNARLWVTFGDGSQLVTTRSRQKPHQHSEEVPQGGELYKITKDGTLSRPLPGVLISEVKQAKNTGRILAVSTDRTLYVSGAQGQGKWNAVGTKTNFYPAFGPRGEKLLFIEQASRDIFHLVLREVKTGKKRVLVRHSGGMSSPCFHPDGTAMVFASNQTGLASLWKVTLPHGIVSQITNIGMRRSSPLPTGFVPPPHEGKIIWAGRWIIFDSGDALWGIRDNGTGAHQIVRESPQSFRWSQPGVQLLYKTSQVQEQIYNLPN